MLANFRFRLNQLQVVTSFVSQVVSSQHWLKQLVLSAHHRKAKAAPVKKLLAVIVFFQRLSEIEQLYEHQPVVQTFKQTKLVSQAQQGRS